MTQSQILNANFDWLQAGKIEQFPEYKIDTQKTMHDRIKEVKRSTFDRSKFTVIGSPTISEDGIASGFSASSTGNYISFDTSNIDWTKSYKIVVSINTKNSLSNVSEVITSKNMPMIFIKEYFGSHKFSFSPAGSFNDFKTIGVIEDTEQVLTNTNYTLVVTHDGNGNYSFSKIINGIEKLIGTKEFTTNLTTGGQSNIGVDTTWHNSFFVNTIDLKQFSITVDGVEIFNGNKTGIDQIKKDDYTVIGNPTISTDGTMTLPSDVFSYIKAPFKIEDYKDKDFEFSYATTVTDNYSAGRSRFFGERYNDNINFVCEYMSIYSAISGGVTVYNTDTQSNEKKSFYIGNVTFNTGDNVVIKQGYKASINTYYLYCYVNNILKYSQNIVSQYKLADINADFRVGSWYDASTNEKGIINLNDCKLIVNGKTEWQATLRIPYTQSKTNEKIVDAVYRDRVQDMYEQFGYTHYYTLGDVPEKYNVQAVGNPTLVGGIASGFSSVNYIKTIQLSELSNKSWTIEDKFYFDNTISGNSSLLGFHSSSAVVGNLCYQQSGQVVFFASMGTSSENTGSGSKIILPNALTSNGWYRYKLSFDIITGKYTLVIYNLSGTVIKEGEYTPSTTNKQLISINTEPTVYLRIGQALGGNVSPSNVITDLSQFSIAVDGKEVLRGYEPAIVDAYTLQTVPNEKIIDSYYADNSFMELTADLSLTQGGGAVSGQTVNLKRPYKDNKYISTIGTTSKATNSFVASASGQWITKGKGVLG